MKIVLILSCTKTLFLKCVSYIRCQLALITLILVFGVGNTFAADQEFCADVGSVQNPAVNEGPLQNPLKGFHIGFFASCCPQFPHEVYFGNYMATVGYQNFKWADLEPSPNEFNWDKVEEDLVGLAGSNNKHVILQVNAEWTKGDRSGRTPQWFLDDPRFEENVDENGEYRSHKYTSPFYQKEVKEFIAEFINRFKDDPRVFIIQIGMVGYFGEFNVFPNDEEWLPLEVKQDFYNHYIDHMFGEVSRIDGDLVAVEGSGAQGILASSYNGKSALTQARYPQETAYNIPTDGVGYTNGWVNFDVVDNDGVNDADIGNKDFNDPLANLESDSGRKLWTYGPIGGEWPPNREPGIEGVIGEWTQFWNTDMGEDYIKRGHYSFIRPPQLDTIRDIVDTDNSNSTNRGADDFNLVPAGWNFFEGEAARAEADAYSDGGGGDRFRKWHKMMGYNYQLSNIAHYFNNDQSHISIGFDIKNVGIAPFYFNWNIELAILDTNDTVVQSIPVQGYDMRQWAVDQTNRVIASAPVTFDVANFPASEYRLALRISQPGALEAKQEAWKLDPRVTYIVMSNEIDTIAGDWNTADANKLVGGWNVLSDVDYTSRGSNCGDEEVCLPIKSKNGNIATVCF